MKKELIAVLLRNDGQSLWPGCGGGDCLTAVGSGSAEQIPEAGEERAAYTVTMVLTAPSQPELKEGSEARYNEYWKKN